MIIQNREIQKFARLSGDYNPVHVDEQYARQTMFGGQIVYGVQQVMLCLEEFARQMQHPVFITGIKAEFRRPLSVGENFEIDVSPEAAGVRMSVREGSGIFSKVNLQYETVESTGVPSEEAEWMQKPTSPSRDVPVTWEEKPGYDPELCRELFPAAERMIHALNLGVLLASTRIIGMRYPGQDSLFRGFNLHFSHHDREGGVMTCTGTPMQSLFGECSVKVESDFVRGELSAFFRPPVIQYNPISVLLKKKLVGDFSRQRALVVGASRGIGMQCARLLAIGRSNGVLVTYNKSFDNIVNLLDELRNYGGIAEAVQIDVVQPAADSLEKIRAFAPTHLYYFATPKISSVIKTLNQGKFERFCNCYIFALNKLIDELKPHGLKGVFVPSSIAIDELPKDMVEYAMAKEAMECWGRAMNADKKKGVRVYMPRFPRIHTAQTQVLLPVEAADAEDILFPEMQQFEKESNDE